jgi:CRISPR system Cascade subunit CasA
MQKRLDGFFFINGYDDVSVKPSRAGLPSISIGWLGQNTIVYAIGRNLFETLMMNLVPLQNGNGELWPKPCPIWECLPRSDERKKIDPPSTPAELFTHQSRRIFLKRENGVITGFNALGGEFLIKNVL